MDASHPNWRPRILELTRTIQKQTGGMIYHSRNGNIILNCLLGGNGYFKLCLSFAYFIAASAPAQYPEIFERPHRSGRCPASPGQFSCHRQFTQKIFFRHLAVFKNRTKRVGTHTTKIFQFASQEPGYLLSAMKTLLCSLFSSRSQCENQCDIANSAVGYKIFVPFKM